MDPSSVADIIANFDRALETTREQVRDILRSLNAPEAAHLAAMLAFGPPLALVRGEHPVPTAEQIEAGFVERAPPRLVLVGGRIWGRAFYEAAVGGNGLRCPRRVDQEYAAAHDLPDGPEAA